MESDFLIMNSFPAKHLSIIEEIIKEKAELEPEEAPIAEEPEEFDLDLEFLEDIDFYETIKQILNSVGLHIYEEEKRKRDEQEKLRQKTRPKKPVIEENVETNSISAIWRMLEAASVSNGFPLTQQGYNFFEDNKNCADWIRRKDVASWDEGEEIRKKCENWLKTMI